MGKCVYVSHPLLNHESESNMIDEFNRVNLYHNEHNVVTNTILLQITIRILHNFQMILFNIMTCIFRDI